MSDEEFLEYIANTLIPDLVESGFEATAEDFQRLLIIVNKLKEQ